jgi:hypothetical protein
MFRPTCFTLFALLLSVSAHAAYDRFVPSDYVPRLLQGGPEAYFQEINSGWNEAQYSSLRRKFKPGRSYIVLHNRLPNTTLDLRTPNGFRESVFRLGLINLKKLDQGHVMIGWSCEIGGERLEGNTGITGEQTNQQMAMANAGWGVTGIFSIFKDGHLQTPKLVSSVVRQAVTKQQRITTLAVEVEPAQCARMLTFIKRFLTHPNQPFKRFGLNANPLKFEGGGCGSFGASALYTSGALPVGESVWRELAVNKKAFGFGIPNPSPEIEPFRVPHEPGESNRINALRGLLVKSWNPSSEENTVRARIMDPELLFLFQQTVMRASLDDVYRDSLELGRALIKSPHVKPRLLKEDKFGWSGGGRMSLAETPVNERFDDRAALVVRGARAWLQDLRTKGYRASGFTFNGEPAVLLAR